MEEASQDMVQDAIKIFKEEYGIYEPLDLLRMEVIIEELKQEQKKVKRKRGEKKDVK